MATIPQNTNSGLYSFSNVVVNQAYGNSNVTSYLATGSDTGGNVLGNIVTTGKVAANAVLTNNYQYANGTAINFAGTYANSNVASFMASGNAMVISTTGNITTTANIAGNFFVGNGSLLTGIAGGGTYSNSNVSSFLAAFGSNVVSTTGNVTAGYLLGNGSQLTGLPATYGNANVAANLAAFGTNPISTSGNITGVHFGSGAGLSISKPLTPDDAEFAVVKINDPLLLRAPYPVFKITRPPLPDDDVPADKTTLPPDPLLPLPTDILN